MTLPAAVQAQFNYTTNNGTITITGYTGPGGVVTIPDTINGLPVTNIGEWAFYFCASLTSVTIGNGVTSIAGWAFAYCTSLTSITIPDSVTFIGNGAFGPCTSLTAITVNALNSVYSSVDGVLFNKSRTTLVQCPGGKAGSYTVPTSVTDIGSEAFASCGSLTNITIPESVTNIGNYAFAQCTSLTSLTIPNSVNSIGIGVFIGCTSLASVTFPNNLAMIPARAFLSCTNLTGVYFQRNAFSVYPGDFYGAENATVYYLPGTTGWGATFGGRPTALWKPQVQTSDASFGVRTNQFGFNIT